MLRCEKCRDVTFKNSYKISEYINKMTENYNQIEFKENYRIYNESLSKCREYIKNYVKEISIKLEKNLMVHMENFLKNQIEFYDNNSQKMNT